jgi:hypothetical protein
MIHTHAVTHTEDFHRLAAGAFTADLGATAQAVAGADSDTAATPGRPVPQTEGRHHRAT